VTEQAGMDRRRFLQIAGLSGVAVGLGGALAGCKSGDDNGGGSASGRTIKLGYVTPKSGSLAGFGEADDYVLASMREIFKDGLQIGGKSYPIQIVVKDTQSDPNRAATVAGDLINTDKVDIVLVSSTPETTNPVTGQCEANGVPCISTVAPWQPWFLGQQKDPANPKPFKWAYHFFWGLEDIEAVFDDMWSQISTNKVIAGLFPNDSDGNAWGDAKNGFPAYFKPKGYRIVDPGRYQNQTDDFSTQIGRYKAADAEILTGVPIPPDFTTFWKQAAQQGFRPKAASVGKALLFPSSIEALGDIGVNLSSEVWWSPNHPFKSSLTGATTKQVAEEYTAKTSKQWTQPIGFAHALFEVAADSLKRAGNPDDRNAIVDAIKATNLDTLVGHIQWTGQPFANVAKTPLVGGQWRKGSGANPYDLVIVSNKDHPDIPTAGTLEALAAT
jgi:branched-chain amino acid transport system substrate-binding protein